MLAEYACHQGGVANITFYKNGGCSGNFFNAIEGFGRTVAQVVDNDNIVASFNQFNAGMAADISGATGDQNKRGAAETVNIRTPVGTGGISRLFGRDVVNSTHCHSRRSVVQLGRRFGEIGHSKTRKPQVRNFDRSGF